MVLRTCHTLVHVDGSNTGVLSHLWPWVDLVDPITCGLLSNEMALTTKLDESYFATKLDMWQVLLVVLGPCWVVVLGVEIGCWAGGAAIGLADSDEAVAYLEVVSYALLDLGAT